jgi:hypothetical protein
MPETTRHSTFMSLELFEHLARFPIPKPHFAIHITTHDKPTIGTKARFTRIPRHQVSRKDFFSIEFEFVQDGKDEDPVVHGLTCQPFP